MNLEILKKLDAASSTEELRNAIETLCLPFGSVKNIRLLSNLQGDEYLCFIELGSPNGNASVIEHVGGINYGDCVAFRIPFKQVKA